MVAAAATSRPRSSTVSRECSIAAAARSTVLSGTIATDSLRPVEATRQSVQLGGDSQQVEGRLAAQRAAQLLEGGALLPALDPEPGRLHRHLAPYAGEVLVRERELTLLARIDELREVPGDDYPP